jgi:hypothetical protein
MKKFVLTFGFLSGAVSSILMLATVPFMDRIGFDHGVVIGYTAMVVSFLFVFFGVRAYRDQSGGAPLTFGRAFTVGILITLISCVCYVVTWEIIYFKIWPGFFDKYTAYAIEKARASGATPQKIDEIATQMQTFKGLYDRPLVNAALSFIEPLPVGLLVTLVSAAVLRRKG